MSLEPEEGLDLALRVLKRSPTLFTGFRTAAHLPSGLALPTTGAPGMSRRHPQEARAPRLGVGNRRRAPATA